MTPFLFNAGCPDDFVECTAKRNHVEPAAWYHHLTHTNTRTSYYHATNHQFTIRLLRCK